MNHKLNKMSESNRIEYIENLNDKLEKIPGVPRILQYYAKDNFKFTNNFIRTTFPNAPGGSIGGSIKLTIRQNQILQFTSDNNKISYRNIAEKLSINESAVKKHLNSLKAEGILKRVGDTRGHWEIINE